MNRNESAGTPDLSYFMARLQSMGPTAVGAEATIRSILQTRPDQIQRRRETGPSSSNQEPST
ncbi:MAG: hypothetical protein ABJQ21_20490 [Roseibium sp.]